VVPRSAPNKRVVAAPDKFRGTATAAEVAAAMCRAASAVGWSCDEAPVADGGEGTLEAIGGKVRHTRVTGPLGQPVDAEWRLVSRSDRFAPSDSLPVPRLRDNTAVIEMARASGLSLVGGAEGNDPMQASSIGTGELIVAALEAGARKVIVGLGGSATTDGGLGALRAFGRHRLHGIDVSVACDVTTRFVDAAEVFAPQKGATPAQVELLRRRLDRLADVYVRDYGVDVRDIPGAGAAGGLAGALAALGAKLVPGFDLVADAIELDERIEGADLIITGEGYLDDQSFEGKAVGGVAELGREAGIPVVAIVGDADPDTAVPGGIEVVSLVERFGEARAMADVIGCVEEALSQRLQGG
jgi:glycerate kinase